MVLRSIKSLFCYVKLVEVAKNSVIYTYQDFIGLISLPFDYKFFQSQFQWGLLHTEYKLSKEKKSYFDFYYFKWN